MLCDRLTDDISPANAGKADARTRTGDPFITSEVLYQLSYVGANARVYVLFCGLPGREALRTRPPLTVGS